MFFSSSMLLVCILLYAVPLTCGHGMLLEPPGRSSRWRFNNSAPINYDDNGVQCGGLRLQWQVYHGQCGLCGDSYGLKRPRPNELGGYFGGVGVITGSYTSAQRVRVGVDLTTNHLGYIYFNLCNLDEFIVESETCFEALLLFADGSERFYVETLEGLFYNEIVLPDNLSCRHCVLRWTYIAGNNWGMCPNGTEAIGCGPQEQFVSCADISINPSFLYNYLLNEEAAQREPVMLDINYLDLN